MIKKNIKNTVKNFYDIEINNNLHPIEKTPISQGRYRQAITRCCNSIFNNAFSSDSGI